MNSSWSSLQFFLLIFAELIALFLGISALVGLVMQYVSDETLRRWLSKNGLLGNCLGATLGALTPFCSCSTIPMTVGLLRAGVPFGATMSFVLASPLLNPIILTMFWVLLGWKACVVYGAVTFLASVLSGVMLQSLGFEKNIKRVRVSGGRERDRMPTFRKKLRFAFSVAWADFRGVLVYLVIGVAIGAAIYGYLPSDFVVRVETAVAAAADKFLDEFDLAIPYLDKCIEGRGVLREDLARRPRGVSVFEGLVRVRHAPAP